MTTPRRSTIGLAAGLLAPGGCARVTQGPFATENVLSAAGFQMKLPDTSERRASLRTLPPRKLLPQPAADKWSTLCGSDAVRLPLRRHRGAIPAVPAVPARKGVADERLDEARTYGYGLDTWGE